MQTEMKTPEEIKKRLNCAITMSRHECKGECAACDDNVPDFNGVEIDVAAIAYIQQLESRLAQAERERDAAVYDLKELADGEGGCDVCGKFDVGYTYLPPHCKYANDDDCWQWRGVCPDNTKEDET